MAGFQVAAEVRWSVNALVESKGENKLATQKNSSDSPSSRDSEENNDGGRGRTRTCGLLRVNYQGELF